MANAPRILIVTAQVNAEITDVMAQSAHAVLETANAKVETVHVAGAMEIPAAIRMASNLASFDGYVAIGAVIGAADGVHASCQTGLMNLGTQQALAIGNGVVCAPDTAAADEAAARIGTHAANAVISLIAMTRDLGGTQKGIGFKPASDHIIIADSSDGKTRA